MGQSGGGSAIPHAEQVPAGLERVTRPGSWLHVIAEDHGMIHFEPRETFARIWESWRDGYADTVAQQTSVTREEFLAHFEDMLETIRDEDGYGVWFVPIRGLTVLRSPCDCPSRLPPQSRWTCPR